MRIRDLIILFSMLVTGCQHNITDSDSPSMVNEIQEGDILGNYTFDLYEGKSLQVLYHGSFVIDRVDGNVFTGTWQMNDESSGTVFCTQENDILFIHLDIPGLLPQEYLLIGNPTNGSITGQWRFNVEVFSMEPSGDWFGAVAVN